MTPIKRTGRVTLAPEERAELLRRKRERPNHPDEAVVRLGAVAASAGRLALRPNPHDSPGGAGDRRGPARGGRVCLNLGSQDYLGLAGDPRVMRAAHRAIEDCGVHSAGSPALLGRTRHSLALECRLAALLRMGACAPLPDGLGRGFRCSDGARPPLRFGHHRRASPQLPRPGCQARRRRGP